MRPPVAPAGGNTRRLSRLKGRDGRRDCFLAELFLPGVVLGVLRWKAGTMDLPSISHPTGRPNFTEVEVGDVTVWFSYRTPVAFLAPGHRITVRENDWGPTTGRHLSYVDGGSKEAKAARVPGEAFEQMVRELEPGVQAAVWAGIA